MRIVVIGGTGLIGSKLVAALREHGHEAVPAAPNTGVNTLTGEGLAAVLEGASVVVDVSNSPSFDDDPAMEFFRTSTTNVLECSAKAGVGHHVALSVVGTDRLLESGYFRAKQAQEKLIRESGRAYSIVHATQFFEFARAIADIGTVDGKVYLPPVLIQPMAATDVAAAVGRVALGQPLNGICEVGGPEQFRLDELVRKALTAAGDPRTVIADQQARYYGIRVGERTLLPGPDARLGEITFDKWLVEQHLEAPAPAPGPPRIDLVGSVPTPPMPERSEAMTIHVTLPPGSAGSPPHRHTGPAFGYVLDGEMLFELEGEPERVVHAGETFWEPGGDVIHYQDGNNLADATTRFVVTMFGDPDRPMLIPVSAEELEERRPRRAPRP